MHLQPSRTFTKELFANIVNGFRKHCTGVSSSIKLLVALKKTPIQVLCCEFCKTLFKKQII